jgi:hypothetical protein
LTARDGFATGVAEDEELESIGDMDGSGPRRGGAAGFEALLEVDAEKPEEEILGLLFPFSVVLRVRERDAP